MVEYNLDWLKEKGFFKKCVPLEIKNKEILIDDKNLLAYVEVYHVDDVEKIKQELSKHKVRYIWFFFPDTGRLKVFRKIGEVKWFYYSARMRSDYLKSRTDKLSRFSCENINILFDIRDIVEKFYWQLWEMRISMANGIKQIKEDKNKLLIVQHMMDRLIFFYFLSQMKLVKIKNEKREWILDRKNTREFFRWICSMHNEEDLQEFLNRIFFDVLGRVHESGRSSLQFDIGGEKFFVISPCLNGGLFIEQEIEGIPERKIKIRGVRKLILDILNHYNWIIGEESPEEEDVIGDLTPEIIGHIYEKFVVSLEQIGIGKIKIQDVQAIREELRYGRKKIGAYYTPEEITNYISMNTIYPYLKDKLKEKFGTTGEVLLDNLFKKNDFSKQELEIIKHLYFEILTKIKICDNACGSGSFLIAAGEILLRLYSRLLKILKDNLFQDRDVKNILEEIRKSLSRNYYIVRHIIVNNLYGIDVMEGAIEIAKLRFWLWLISHVDPRKVEGKRIETLPNLDFNLMVGNSLIGFVDIEDIEFDFITVKPKKRWQTLEDKQILLTTYLSKEKIELLKHLAKEKQKFKTLPAHEAVKLKEKLNEELEKSRGFLDRKFYDRLKVKGMEIPYQELLGLKPFHWGFEFYEVFDLEKPKEERGFDVMIGNPPYVENKKMTNKIEKEMLKIYYISAYKLFDYALVFIERSYHLLKKNGFFSYIVTNKFISTDYGVKLREFILKNTELRELLDVSNIEIFKGIAVYPIIIIFKKARNQAKTLVGIKISDEFQISKKTFEKLLVPQNKFLEIPNYIFDISGNLLLCEKIRENSKPLGDICDFYYRVLGFTDWVNVLKFVTKEKPVGKCLKFIGTTNIVDFIVDTSLPLRVAGRDFKNCYLKFSPSFSEECWRLFQKKKLLIKEIAKTLTTAYDEGEYANLTGMYMVLPKNDFSLFYLLGLLNSKLLDYYFRSLYGTTHMAGGYLRFNGSYLKELPISIPSDYERVAVETISKIIYNLKRISLYGTSTQEIKRITESLTDILNVCIYEIYFKEGLKTGLCEKICHVLNKVQGENWVLRAKKLIKEVEKLSHDLLKISSHPQVKTIESSCSD